MSPNLLPTEVASSREAQYIDKVSKDVSQHWLGYQSLGNAAVLDELGQLYEECRVRDWDGYDAEPLDESTVFEARRFLRALPADINRPVVGAEPDGQITFEWTSAPRQIVSVSISSGGDLHFAALINSRRLFGTEPLLDECPRVITDLIRRIRRA